MRCMYIHTRAKAFLPWWRWRPRRQFSVISSIAILLFRSAHGESTRATRAPLFPQFRRGFISRILAMSSSPPSMSEIITQTVTRKNDDEDDDMVGTLEFLGEPCDNVHVPFNPERHGLPADFQLTKFSDSRRRSLLLDRQDRQLMVNLLDVKEVITLQWNWKKVYALDFRHWNHSRYNPCLFFVYRLHRANVLCFIMS